MKGSAAVWLTALLCGCALAPPPDREAVRKDALPNTSVPANYAAGGSASAVRDQWLAEFKDRELDALVAEAVAYNADLRVAQARVELAAAYLKASGATLYPQVNLLARGGGKMSDSSGLSGVGFFANWEIDLWGRVRASQAFSQEQYAAAQLDAEYARQSIAALVAKGWFLATEARMQKAQATAMRTSSEELVSLSQDRLRVGRGDEYDVTIAQASVASLRDTERSLDAAYLQALRALEVLVGRYPAAAIQAPPRLASWPGDVPVGLPSELLERRPDVVGAERRVAGAFYRTEEAKAARLPRITLTANLTSISSELFVLQNHDNPVFSFGASLLQPLFLGGQLQAQVDVRTAEQKQAIAEYARISARAFAEVEDALSNGFALADRETYLMAAVRENTRGLDLSGVRFRVGSGDLRGVQQQQLSLYSAQVALLRVQAERLVQRVNLYLALGGGFDARPPPINSGSASDKQQSLVR
jgi:multidrug efflux system outer membrane protein